MCVNPYRLDHQMAEDPSGQLAEVDPPHCTVHRTAGLAQALHPLGAEALHDPRQVCGSEQGRGWRGLDAARLLRRDWLCAVDRSTSLARDHHRCLLDVVGLENLVVLELLMMVGSKVGVGGVDLINFYPDLINFYLDIF